MKYPAKSAGWEEEALLTSTPCSPSAVCQWRCRCGLRELDLLEAPTVDVEEEVRVAEVEGG